MPVKKKKTSKAKKKKTSAKDARKARREALLNRERETNKRINAGSIGFFKPDLGDTVQFWRCGVGDHVIDVIPYQAGDNDGETSEGDYTYGFYCYEHRDVGGKEGQSYICLDRTYGEPCPICKHRRQLEKEGGDEGLIKTLRTSRYPRSIYNIISYDHNEEEKGIQVFHTSYFLLENSLKKLLDDPRRRGQRSEATTAKAHWADPDDGKSIAFTREGEKMATRFIGHRLLDRDYTIEDEILDEAHQLDQLVHKPTYEEVYEAYWGEPVDDEEEETTTSRSRSTRQTRKPKRRREVEEEEVVDEEELEDEDFDNEEEEEGEEEEAVDEGEEEEDEGEEEEMECGYDGEFGVDFNSLDACDDCEDWDECQEAFEAAEKERKKKAKKKKGKKKKRS